MKTFKQIVEEFGVPFAMPDYPMQKDNVKYINGGLAVGEGEKAYEYDTSKSGYENIDTMNDLVKQDRAE